MEKKYSKFNSFVGIFLALLVISLPVTFAEQIDIEEQGNLNDENILLKPSQIQDPNSPSNVFLGLPAWLIAILTGASIYYIAIGAAVIAGGYLVYHVAEKAWVYYKAYSYTKMSKHAYDHINDFTNIWRGTPSKSKFERKCRDVMNSRSSERYLQKSNGRNIAYNPSLQMIVVGETDGKTIVTCFRDSTGKYVPRKIRDGEWIRVK